MLEASAGKFTYDSANRLITADTRYYVYDVEGTRVSTQRGEDVTKFVYNVNARLSQLLIKTENNAVTKYVYGLGLIGEEVSGSFKVYHFDYRGSTVAITNANGTVTDTFEYDTYGKLTARTGTTKTPFLYNGRDGVMYEDDTGLIYMRARYYCLTLRRFVNADKVHGDISNALTLNRYAFVNGNPAVNVDPEGLSAERVGVGTAWGGINGTSYSSSAIAQRRRQLDEAIRKYRKLHPIGEINVEELKRLMGNGMVWNTSSNFNITALENGDVTSPTIIGTAVNNAPHSESSLLKEAQNKDGTYSLYDNQRRYPDAIFHEQILSLGGNHGFNISEGKMGFNYSLQLFNGGWEFENIDLSLLDFGQVSAGIGFTDDYKGLTLQATAYAPSVTVTIFGWDVSFEADIGSIGLDFSVTDGKYRASGALLFGGGITISKSKD